MAHKTMDPHRFGKQDPHQDPHQIGRLDPDPHQSKKQDPDLHQSEKVEALEGHFGALEGPNLEKVSGGIRIRIKLKGRIRIRIRVRGRIRIRIRIKVKSRIHNTDHNLNQLSLGRLKIDKKYPARELAWY
jgi:hypothetical protein